MNKDYKLYKLSTVSLRTTLILITFFCFAGNSMAWKYKSVDKNNPIEFINNKIIFKGDTITLGKQHLFLDGNIPNEITEKYQYVYNSFQKAVENADKEGKTTIHIAPWVYWIDNPDDNTIKKGKGGMPPIGMTVKGKELYLHGLSDDASNIVLASQRGQTMGADGNFTMFNFLVDKLIVRNITFGNYLNVDLKYELNENMSRKRKSDNIVQAQLAFQRGSDLDAENCRFVSRLNLCPIIGAKNANYKNCHFESTDDALNGEAVYRDCHFDFYSSKPIYRTSGKGAVFISCTFNVKHNGSQYITKHSSPVRLINCRFILPENNYIGWTPYPEKWLRCEQHKVCDQNGNTILVGKNNPENTVNMDNRTEEPYCNLHISSHKATIYTGKKEVTLNAAFHNADGTPYNSKKIHWKIDDGGEGMINVDTTRNGQCVVIPDNNTDETADFCITAYTEDGYQQACQLTVVPRPLPAPTFTQKPKITVKNGKATVEYKLSEKNRTDESRIEWWHGGKENCPVSISRGKPEDTYMLTQDDAGKELTVKVWPKYKGSEYGEAVEYSIKEIKEKQVVASNILETDFHNFPTTTSNTIKDGGWTIGGYKPEDCKEWDWQTRDSIEYWHHGKSNNGCVGEGLYQTEQGARLLYTPRASYGKGDMKLELIVDPQKTAGQGFSSARGQYMDIGIKMDTHSLSGYALRIIRTKKYSNAVDFMLVEYKDGKVTPISKPVSSTCYRTNCTIRICLEGTSLKASASTTTAQPESKLAKEVHLEANVTPADYGGILIQHTGTTGEGKTMLHKLKAEYIR